MHVNIQARFLFWFAAVWNKNKNIKIFISLNLHIFEKMKRDNLTSILAMYNVNEFISIKINGTFVVTQSSKAIFPHIRKHYHFYSDVLGLLFWVVLQRTCNYTHGSVFLFYWKDRPPLKVDKIIWKEYNCFTSTDFLCMVNGAGLLGKLLCE